MLCATATQKAVQRHGNLCACLTRAVRQRFVNMLSIKQHIEVTSHALKCALALRIQNVLTMQWATILRDLKFAHVDYL